MVTSLTAIPGQTRLSTAARAPWGGACIAIFEMPRHFGLRWAMAHFNLDPGDAPGSRLPAESKMLVAETSRKDGKP